jgi:hypothetical protein
MPTAGNSKLNFYVRYIRESVDPGSIIGIKIDNEVVWSVSPHFIIDSPEDYILKSAELGHLDAGMHTIEIFGYEQPIGGDAPMQFAFDDFTLQAPGTTSIDIEEKPALNFTCLRGLIQIMSVTRVSERGLVAKTARAAPRSLSRVRRPRCVAGVLRFAARGRSVGVGALTAA